jgi:hypothetical protein
MDGQKVGADLLFRHHLPVLLEVIVIDNFGKESGMSFEKGFSQGMKERCGSLESSSPKESPASRDQDVGSFFPYRAMIFLVGFLFLSGCGSEPSYRQAFNSSEQIQGNTESISASQDRAWAASLRVLSQQGFMVRSADKANAIILADREMTDQNDKNTSYQITSTVTFVPLGQGITQVSLAANQTTELHRKEYVWWHLLWLIPLFPIGSEYNSVVTQRGTVQNPEFYAGFFDNLKALLKDKTANGIKK